MCSNSGTVRHVSISVLLRLCERSNLGSVESTKLEVCRVVDWSAAVSCVRTTTEVVVGVAVGVRAVVSVDKLLIWSRSIVSIQIVPFSILIVKISIVPFIGRVGGSSRLKLWSDSQYGASSVGFIEGCMVPNRRVRALWSPIFFGKHGRGRKWVSVENRREEGLRKKAQGWRRRERDSVRNASRGYSLTSWSDRPLEPWWDWLRTTSFEFSKERRRILDWIDFSWEYKRPTSRGVWREVRFRRWLRLTRTFRLRFLKFWILLFQLFHSQISIERESIGEVRGNVFLCC